MSAADAVFVFNAYLFLVSAVAVVALVLFVVVAVSRMPRKTWPPVPSVQPAGEPPKGR